MKKIAKSVKCKVSGEFCVTMRDNVQNLLYVYADSRPRLH